MNRKSASPEATRADLIHSEIQEQDYREYQLWTVFALLFLVALAGFASLLLPNIIWDLEELRVDGRYLPQLLFGFITLVALFYFYVLEKRRELRRTREELRWQLVRNEGTSRLSFIDPLTNVFNHHFLEYVLPREAKRADRTGVPLSLLKIAINDFQSAIGRSGAAAGDRYLRHAATVLMRTFRQTDTITRRGESGFLVVLPDTDEASARAAIDRLLGEAASWDPARSPTGCPLSLSCGVATYVKGRDLDGVLELADSRARPRQTGGNRRQAG